MSKWKIEYGMCDGTGPHSAESIGEGVKMAIHNFSQAHPTVDPCNINSVTRQADKPSAIKDWHTKPTFINWAGNKRFSIGSRPLEEFVWAVINWVEETR